MADQAMRGWALKGAEQRLLEISEEAAAIYKAFPELRDRGGRADEPTRRKPGRPRKTEGQASASTPRRRKRTMSVDARKRISEAQKARWAKQKEAAVAAPKDERAAASGRRGGRKKR